MSRAPSHRRRADVESVDDISTEYDSGPRRPPEVHATHGQASASGPRTIYVEGDGARIPPPARPRAPSRPGSQPVIIEIDPRPTPRPSSSIPLPTSPQDAGEHTYDRRRRSGYVGYDDGVHIRSRYPHENHEYEQRQRPGHGEYDDLYRSRAQQERPGTFGRYSTFERRDGTGPVASPMVMRHDPRRNGDGRQTRRRRSRIRVHATALHEEGGGGDAGGSGADSDSGEDDQADDGTERRGNKHLNLFLAAQRQINDPSHFVICMYRSSKRDFDARKIRFKHDGDDRKLREDGHGIGKYLLHDRDVFAQMQRQYTSLQGWRAILSFRTVRTARLLKYGSGQLFELTEWEGSDVIFTRTFIVVFKNPTCYIRGESKKWTHWIYRMKQPLDEQNLMLAIELQEVYDPLRITIAVGVLLSVIVGLSVAWLIEGGDPGNVSTVMSYVLALFGAVIALTTIWDWFDGGESEKARMNAVLEEPGRGMFNEYELAQQRIR